MFTSKNPFTRELKAKFPPNNADDLLHQLAAASKTQRQWRNVPLQTRASVLLKVADLYAERQEELSTLISEEMGKPISHARGEIGISERIYRYYGENASGFLKDKPIETNNADTAYVSYQPTGVLLGVMPWNYPFYQVARFAAPNLLLGNAILLKHASNCPRSSLAIEKIFHEAGIFSAVYQNIFADHAGVARLISDDRIQGVSFTGSEYAGSIIAQQAAKHLKKCVLELGGNDPFIVWGEGSYSDALQALISGRLGNAGQACTSPKRVIVQEEIFEQFVVDVTEAFSSLSVTDPLNDECKIGPLSSEAAVNDILEIIEDAVEQGATLHTGGKRSSITPNGLEPTVLTNVGRGMRAYREEIFGPVAVMYSAKTVEDALTLANDTPYGLGAAVFSKDTQVLETLSKGIESGMVYTNMNTDSEPHLPFGGIKRSGYGRELGPESIKEFANEKLFYHRAQA